MFAFMIGQKHRIWIAFCLFNIISPLMSVLVALIGWNIKKAP